MIPMLAFAAESPEKNKTLRLVHIELYLVQFFAAICLSNKSAPNIDTRTIKYD